MLALFCGTASLPHILIRYYTVKDEAAARGRERLDACAAARTVLLPDAREQQPQQLVQLRGSADGRARAQLRIARAHARCQFEEMLLHLRLLLLEAGELREPFRMRRP